MGKGLIGFLSFVAGTAVGYFTATALLKTVYEQKAEEEITSVKDAFKRELERREKKPDKKSDRSKYVKKVRDLGYDGSPRKEVTAPKGRIEVIPPEEVCEEHDWEVISLTMFADGTVTDDTDLPMSKEEIEEAVGLDSLKRFGEYEDDSVHVINEPRKVYYEILKDERNYKKTGA